MNITSLNINIPINITIRTNKYHFTLIMYILKIE